MMLESGQQMKDYFTWTISLLYKHKDLMAVFFLSINQSLKYLVTTLEEENLWKLDISALSKMILRNIVGTMDMRYSASHK